MRDSRELMLNAYRNSLIIPAFNIPYLPMVAPVARALTETNAFGFVEVSRIEWERFEAGSQAAARQEYLNCYQEPWMRLHQDHVPVIDEDGNRVDYLAILQRAIDLHFDSIMVDGSRLPLDENIVATREVVALAAPHGTPVEAELGAVLGHEAGPLPPYEELFRSGRGFTGLEEAVRFVEETGVDWLSVACGNIHGAIRGAAMDQEKVHARLNIAHLAKLKAATGVPLVLHGGSGIEKASILAGVANGISKINIGTDIRQAYEQARRAGEGVSQAQERVYARACQLITDVLEVEGSRDVINPA